MWQLVFDFSLGVAVSAYGTLVGAGGGFLLVPLLLLLREFPHTLAAGTSLAVVATTSLSGTIGFLRDKRIDFRAGILFAAFTVPGAIGGVFLSDLLDGRAFHIAFGCALLLVSLYLLVRGGRKEGAPHRGKTGWGWVHREAYSYFEPIGAAASLFVGAASSLFGIGGGIVYVPLMSEVLRIPVRVAVATSQFITLFTALTGLFSHLSRGHVSWPTALPMMAGAVVGAQFGVWLSKRIGGPLTVRLLSIALLVVGAKLIYG